MNPLSRLLAFFADDLLPGRLLIGAEIILAIATDAYVARREAEDAAEDHADLAMRVEHLERRV